MVGDEVIDQLLPILAAKGVRATGHEMNLIDWLFRIGMRRDLHQFNEICIDPDLPQQKEFRHGPPLHLRTAKVHLAFGLRSCLIRDSSLRGVFHGPTGNSTWCPASYLPDQTALHDI